MNEVGCALRKPLKHNNKFWEDVIAHKFFEYFSLYAEAKKTYE
jgi:hypothetical protein